jgi:hypothetical protein
MGQCRDTSWTEDLSPDEARAALDALNANKGAIKAREAVELLKLKRALEAKAERRSLPALFLPALELACSLPGGSP